MPVSDTRTDIPTGEPVYIEMLMATASAQLGKMKVGQIVQTHQAQADRYYRLGVAQPSTKEAYDRVKADKEELDRRYQAELDAQAEARRERLAARSEGAIKARIGAALQREREMADAAVRDDPSLAQVAARQTPAQPLSPPPPRPSGAQIGNGPTADPDQGDDDTSDAGRRRKRS